MKIGYPKTIWRWGKLDTLKRDFLLKNRTQLRVAVSYVGGMIIGKGASAGGECVWGNWTPLKCRVLLKNRTPIEYRGVLCIMLTLFVRYRENNSVRSDRLAFRDNVVCGFVEGGR